MTSITLVVTMILLGYVAIYLTTPLELAGHLYSSLHRLLMHVWPLVLIAYFLRMATPEEALGRSQRHAAAESSVAPARELAKMECNA